MPTAVPDSRTHDQGPSDTRGDNGYLWPCILVLMLSQSAVAVPRMSLPAGSPCATCHQNSNGGGGRNQVGWETSHKMGALDFGWGVRKNTIAHDRISLGFDSRIQFVHLGRPRYQQDDSGQIEKVDPDFTAIPMQLQPEVGIKLNRWLSVTGQYNPGGHIKRQNLRSCLSGTILLWSALIIKPRPGIEIRGGMLQPAIGIRPDDHTVYVLTPIICAGLSSHQTTLNGGRNHVSPHLLVRSKWRLSYGSPRYRAQ